MFAANFDYYRASSVADAGRLLAEHPGAKLLAGGHSLIPLLKLRLAAPSAVIDIGRIAELRGISAGGDGLRIGALTTHAEIAASSDVQQHAAALAEAASQIGDPAVRNRGTIGGNLAHADPASDLPTVLAALGATLSVVGPGGERSIAADGFFQGLMMTALGENEVLTAITVPAAGGAGSAYAKFPHPASRYAVVGAAANVTASNGTCSGASVAVGGLTPAPVRCAGVEGALSGQALTAEAIAAAAEAVAGDVGEDLIGDVFASAEYRKAVASVYVRRALTAAAERAG
ncbi:MAG: xanthine dehydrogenase family protein subunit M [Acidobacteria bacterium]|nr:xanthine dehydrogenase family protein subunit M [Acidobacteriota bacterium]MYD70595.1 xanthine dehydrogenase family protein subunit M [Acidobacteriota bacterium]MYJ03228.1 xanthine dehydrogenase family protein subunit M [Acidobacteriota bacterium]